MTKYGFKVRNTSRHNARDTTPPGHSIVASMLASILWQSVMDSPMLTTSVARVCCSRATTKMRFLEPLITAILDRMANPRPSS